jgi:acyl-CoA dehydrogenase
VLDNLPNRVAAWGLRVLCFPLGARARGPSDALAGAVARGLLDGGALRERLTRDIHLPREPGSAMGRLEHALSLALAAAPVEKRLKDALRAGRLAEEPEEDLLLRAVAAGVLADADLVTLRAADAARHDAILVDAFSPEDFAALRG